MAQARVDKEWAKKGLSGYETPAILGTLNHYGIEIDEPKFKALAGSKYPLAIAEGWLGQWKGTGQFSRFPFAAASELWRRFEKDRLSPFEFVEALLELMGALAKLLDGKQDSPVGPAFKRVDELKPKVPLTGGKPDEAFVEEVFTSLGKGAEAFRHLPGALAKEGHVDDAESFAEVEEFLFPERAGVSKALVKAESGERDAAISALEAIAQDAQRERVSRLSAIDGLLQVDALDPALKHGEPLFAEAEKANDFHLALDAGQRLLYAYDKKGQRKPFRELEEKMTRLAEAHQAAHPHHA